MLLRRDTNLQGLDWVKRVLLSEDSLKTIQLEGLFVLEGVMHSVLYTEKYTIIFLIQKDK